MVLLANSIPISYISQQSGIPRSGYWALKPSGCSQTQKSQNPKIQIHKAWKNSVLVKFDSHITDYTCIFSRKQNENFDVQTLYDFNKKRQIDKLNRKLIILGIY